MAIPEFIKDLRVDIGTKLLPIVGAAAVVVDADGRVLLGLRADNKRWAVPGGILEPGEQPAVGAVREILEETGVEIEVERLLGVRSAKPNVYRNGDVIQSTTLIFRARPIGGEARVNDDESLEVGWFAPDDLPESVSAGGRFAIDLAFRESREAWFATS